MGKRTEFIEGMEPLIEQGFDIADEASRIGRSDYALATTRQCLFLRELMATARATTDEEWDRWHQQTVWQRCRSFMIGSAFLFRCRRWLAWRKAC